MVQSLEKFLLSLKRKRKNNLKNPTYSLGGFLCDEMKIGVILRPVGNRYTLNKEIEEVIAYYGGTVVGITRYNESLLESLDGAILQGGEDYTKTDLDILTFLYKRDIPTLGICLGMQTMGVLFHGELKKIENHCLLEEKEHTVFVNKDSKFFEFVRAEEFLVNSRHQEALTTTEMDTIGVSNDGVIEVIEDKKKKFFIGVEWHPETNFLNKEISKKLFNAFFETVRNS